MINQFDNNAMFGSPNPALTDPVRYAQNSSTPVEDGQLKSQSHKPFRLKKQCSPNTTATYLYHNHQLANTNFTALSAKCSFNFQRNLQLNQFSVSSPSSSSAGSNYRPRNKRDLETCYSETSSPQSGSQRQRLGDDSNSDTSGNNDCSINVSLCTNPPTTPVSASVSGSCSQTPASPSSSMLCSLMKKQDLKSTTTTTTTTSSSSVSSSSQMPPPRPLHVTPASSTSPSSDNSSTNFSSRQTYSRTTSIDSLSSYADYFRVNGHQGSSDSQSEYTPATECMTPASYSDLPDSPSEPHAIAAKFLASETARREQKFQREQAQFEKEQMHLRQKQLYHESMANSAMRFNYQPTPDELSNITVDSTASKSNDITMVEKTILAPGSNYNSLTRSHGKSLQNQSQSFQRSGHSSSDSSRSSSFLVNQTNGLIPKSSINYSATSGVLSANFTDSIQEDISYDQVDSDCDGSVRRYCPTEDDTELWSETKSVHSNVSALTFPNEPVDINLMKSLLANAATSKQQRPQQHVLKTLPILGYFDFKNTGDQDTSVSKRPPWATSNYTPLSQISNQNQAMYNTPPVKLQASGDSSLASKGYPNLLQVLPQAQRSLNFTGQEHEFEANIFATHFNTDQEDEVNSLRIFNDERDETKSVTCSIPSIIKDDLESTALNTTGIGNHTNDFSLLLNKINSVNSSRYDPINESSSSHNWTMISHQKPLIDKPQVSLNNSPFNNNIFQYHQQHQPSKQRLAEEYADLNNQVAQEDTAWDSSMNQENVYDEEEDDYDQKVLNEFIDKYYNEPQGSFNNDEDSSQNETYQDEVDSYQSTDCLNNIIPSNRVTLPKIDEADEEEEYASTRNPSELKKKKSGLKPAPVIQMNKTALLRANKFKEMKSASAASKASKPFSSSSSNRSLTGHRFVKENLTSSSETGKKPATVNLLNRKPTSSDRLSNIAVLTANNMHANKFNKN